MKKETNAYLFEINFLCAEKYKTNFASLEKVICVKAENDTVIWPNESEWWGQYTDGQGIAPENLLSLKDTGITD